MKSHVLTTFRVGVVLGWIVAAVGCGGDVAPAGSRTLGVGPSATHSTAPDVASALGKPVDYDGSGRWITQTTFTLPYAWVEVVEVEFAQNHKGDLSTSGDCGTSTCTLELKRQRPGTTIRYQLRLTATGGDRSCIDVKGTVEIDTVTNTLTGHASGMNWYGDETNPPGCLHEEGTITGHKVP